MKTLATRLLAGLALALLGSAAPASAASPEPIRIVHVYGKTGPFQAFSGQSGSRATFQHEALDPMRRGQHGPRRAAIYEAQTENVGVVLHLPLDVGRGKHGIAEAPRLEHQRLLLIGMFISERMFRILVMSAINGLQDYIANSAKITRCRLGDSSLVLMLSL